MKRYLFSLLSAGILVWLVIYYPPGHFTWARFFADRASAYVKLKYLSEAYVVPALLAFVSITMFQINMRLSMFGARASTVFPLSLIASLAMLMGYRTLSAGFERLPGFTLGLALAYTVMSRIYAIRWSPPRFGVTLPIFVWRGDKDGIKKVRELAASRAAAPGAMSE